MTLKASRSQEMVAGSSLYPRLKASPFVKWAGGKSQLLAHLQPLFPSKYRRFFEPFLGGGAVFFSLQPEQAVLGDANRDLVETYLVVRDRVEDLIADLQRHEWSKDYYYALRAVATLSLDPVQRASRFIFLNKTGYNGLYRVNRQGQFNVPFGRYKHAPRVYDPEILRNDSVLLQRAAKQVRCQDFEAAMAEAGTGDFIYLDPPYDPLSVTANFTGYTAESFGRSEQERLAHAIRGAAGRGCLILLNNSDTPFIRELYQEFHVKAVAATRAINSDPTKRKGAVELIVTNY